MALTAEQLAARDGRLTASRVKTLMTGTALQLIELWREMIGDPAFVDEKNAELSNKWFVWQGNYLEPAILNWHEFKTGHAVTRRGEVVIHPKADWAACTLDGWVDAIPAPMECKCLNGFNPPRDQAVATYFPQVTWQMLVTGTKQCVFSCVFGGAEPVTELVSLDERYATELWSRAERFMACVWELRPPVAMPAVEAPQGPLRIISMQGNNEWGDAAATWLETQVSAKRFETAVKSIKAMVPGDASEAHGNGITVKRSRANALSIKAKEAA